MSNVRLNIVDARRIVCGIVHGSVGDSCIAALSAEPETIEELEYSLTRYMKPLDESGALSMLKSTTRVDAEVEDAGVLVIDLVARIVAIESTYSQPGKEGQVSYHDGTAATDVSVLYQISDDWLFLYSIDQYEFQCATRRNEREAMELFDARAVLYGRELTAFVASGIRDIAGSFGIKAQMETYAAELSERESYAYQDALDKSISSIHVRWLMTARADLQNQTPRNLLLARQDFVDFDLHSRQMQWSFQGEGPPCLSKDSGAYRFAGFGTHECVVYYDLIRHLLWDSLFNQNPDAPLKSEIDRLDAVKTSWLECEQSDYGGKIPAIIIENERRRLPITMSSHDVMISDDCEVCVAMARDIEMGLGVSFWHLDGSHMGDSYPFSFYRTYEEWQSEMRKHEEFDKEFERKWGKTSQPREYVDG